jgi:sialate O-acetylesterase
MFFRKLAAAFLLLFSHLTYAQNNNAIRMPAVFSDNMVLQQGIPAPVWGTASPSQPILVDIGGKSAETRAGNDGTWMIKLPLMKAGGPHTMRITSGKQTITFKNVMVGEVWICSGQSNMEMPLAGWGKIRDFEKEIAAANYPMIRLLQVKHQTSNTIQKDVAVDSGQWKECSPLTIGSFSSVAYFFAKNIHENRHVPVGLIHSSWGGTIAEAWTSGASLKKMPDFEAAVVKMENPNQSATGKNLSELMQEWQHKVNLQDSGFNNTKAEWASVDLNANSWKTMSLPTEWEKAGLDGFDGIAWFRKKITLPANWSGQDLQVSLGPIDDDDVTYFNGTMIGHTEGYTKPRVYSIPASLTKPGDNVITVRVLDNGGNGGLNGSPEQLFIRSANSEKTAITGEWLYRVSSPATSLPARPPSEEGPNRPTVLYNAMIAPIIPYGIRGAIWYQGESNASRAYQYRELFPLLISDWRQQWKKGNFPFLFVQLANFKEPRDEPGDSDWAELREAQLKTLAVPATGMAVIIDIGEAQDIHPKNKQDVGTRLAYIARAKVYGESIPYSGPVYQSFKKQGKTLSLSFTNTSGGLSVKGDTLHGFAIAGADKKFYWANARIDGNHVVLSSPMVPDPVAARYAWADNPVCNLYDGAGLPASPFRTDDWEMITNKKK